MIADVAKPKFTSLWKPLAIILLIAGALILWSLFAPRPSTPLAFEILGFEGDVQIYDLQSHAWRAPKRGEEFASSQELKTGADGLVNFQFPDEIRMRLKENSSLKNESSRLFGKTEVFKLRLTEGVLLGATTRQFERKQKTDNSVLEILTRDYVATIHGAIFRVQSSVHGNKVGVLRGFVEVSKPGIFFRNQGVRIRGLEETSVEKGIVQPAVRVTPAAWGLMKESYELLEKTAVTEAQQIDLSRNAGSFFKYVFDHGTFYTPKVGYANRDFFKDPDSGQVFLETEYDVFPTGSFAGVYIKTRDFDIAKFQGLAFEVRKNPEEGAPDSFFIELKSKGNVVRRFAPKTFERNWKLMEFDFHANKSIVVNEVVFVFTNVRAGESKKGVLEFRNMDLIPLPAAATLKKDMPSTAPVQAVTSVKTAVPATSPVQPAVAVQVPAAPSQPSAGVASALAPIAPAQPFTTAPAAAPGSKETPAVPAEVPLQ